MARCNCSPMCEKCCNGPCDCTCPPEPPVTIESLRQQLAVAETAARYNRECAEQAEAERDRAMEALRSAVARCIDHHIPEKSK